MCVLKQLVLLNMSHLYILKNDPIQKCKNIYGFSNKIKEKEELGKNSS